MNRNQNQSWTKAVKMSKLQALQKQHRRLWQSSTQTHPYTHSQERKWTKAVETMLLHNLKHCAESCFERHGHESTQPAPNELLKLSWSHTKMVSNGTKLKELQFYTSFPNILPISDSCHATLHLTSWLNCFTGLDPGLSTLDGILT